MDYGRQGDDLATLVKEEILGIHNDVGRQIVGSRVRKILQELDILPAMKEAQRLDIESMTTEQARSFGRTKMPYGQHKGSYIDNVPLEYLDFIAEDKDPFKRDLRRYLASRRVAQERED